MERVDGDRRALIAGVGGVVVGSLIAGKAMAGSPKKGAELQAVLDKIARTDQGFGECCLPVQAFPGTGSAAFTLTEPGSYYLNGNVIAAPGQDGIEIAGSNIDLDLNGYSVLGQPDAAGGVSGRGIVGVGSNLCVYDGNVAYFDCSVDFHGASHSIVWDVTAIDGGSCGFASGPFNQNYDTEVHRHRSGIAYLVNDQGTLLQEGGAFSCAVGFRIGGSKNLLLANSATDCPVPFDIDASNAWAPIVVASGDLSLIPNGQDPNANLVL